MAYPFSEPETEVYLADISPQDKPWDVHKCQSTIVSELYQLSFERYAERIADCANSLAFALKTSDNGETKLKLSAAKFCRVRHCPTCQWRRTLMWRARFLKNIPLILEEYPSARFIFLTLTVRNCPLNELRETVGKMNKAFVRLSQRKDFPAIGWVKTLEVTRNPKDGTAHPHFHCLLMVPSTYFKKGYLNQKRWTELWKESLRVEYTPIVHVQVVKNKSSSSKHELPKAICETLKYSVKPSDLAADPKWLEGLTQQLHKLKAISLGGIFKEKMSEEDPEDLINSELEDEEQLVDKDTLLIFDWIMQVRKYRQKNS